MDIVYILELGSDDDAITAEQIRTLPRAGGLPLDHVEVDGDDLRFMLTMGVITPAAVEQFKIYADVEDAIYYFIEK